MLEVEQITRRFGDLVALDDVSFRVEPGAMTGFVGPNGAGKTTAMRIIAGVLTQDGGAVRWNGESAGPSLWRSIGYMPEERGLYPKMPLISQLVYLARLRGTDATTAKNRAEELLERLGLGDRGNDRLDALSLGNAQRVQLVAALVADPELLILDEPFSGLDPLALDLMVDLLRERVDAGAPVLFSSHQLSLVERLCDRVIVIGHGRIVAAGRVEELRAAGARPRFRVTTPERTWIDAVTGLSVVADDGDVVEVELADSAAPEDVLAAAVAAGGVRAFEPVRPTLDQIFREVLA